MNEKKNRLGSEEGLDRVSRTGLELEQLLRSGLHRLKARFLAYGTGWLCAVLAAALLCYYLADRSLHLPTAVRIVVSLGLAAYLLVILRGRVLYPLKHKLGRDDMAVAFERRFPELEERLISAVQFSDLVRGQTPGAAPDLRNQSPAMIARVVEEAAKNIHAVPQRKLLEAKRTLRVWTVAAAASLAFLSLMAQNPDAGARFFQRIFGASAAYPHLTSLYLELPESAEFQIRKQGPRSVRLTMAAGGDLPVLVRADGVVPREVFLAIAGGRGLPPRVSLTSRPGGRFRHVFRRVAKGFSFRATGGDDERGDLDVEVRTIRPPQVGTIRAVLTFPAYTQVPPQTQFGGSVEALEGTKVDVQMSVTSAVASARMQFLESGASVVMKPVTVEEEGARHELLVGTFTVGKTDRYQIELKSPAGLGNPHPASYPVLAIIDHPPLGRMLLPADDHLNVVLHNGIVAVRLEARDDYGLSSVSVLCQFGRTEESLRLPLLAGAKGPRPTRTLVTKLFELSDLSLAGSRPAVGDTIMISAEMVDNRLPEALKSALTGRPIHVIGLGDLSRRIAGHFRRIRADVEKAHDLQKNRHERLAEISEELDSGGELPRLQASLTAIEVGQARIQSAASRIHAELMRSFNLHLFNKLETSPHAAEALELYVSFHSANHEARAFLPEFYEMLGEQRRLGKIGSMPKILDPILEMTLSASRIARNYCPSAVKLLAAAGVAPKRTDVARALDLAAARQQAILEELAVLLDRLDEWNEFQDVISQTRALRDKQRDVQTRTKDALKGPGK